MHLADAFIQSDLFRLYIYCQYVCSLGLLLIIIIIYSFFTEKY